MKYLANPVIANAEIIIATDAVLPDGTLGCHLSDGIYKTAGKEMLARFTPQPGDYWVTQADGYEYLNPKDVFERKYSPLPMPNSMPFGLALECLKVGSKVARRGWNGKAMWLAYSPGSQALPAANFWAGANRDYALANGGTADVLPCITMKTASGEILMGWLPSQSDMLASDWEIVE